MDFTDTPQEAEYRAKVRAFLDANAERKEPGKLFAKKYGEEGLVPLAKEWQAKKYAAGFSGITMPKEYGGQGLTAMEQVIYNQEESNYLVPRGAFEIGLGMCIPTMLMYATEEQKQRYAGPALEGKEIWCQLFSEPAGGSDVANAKTRAVRDGDDWIINGQKIWTSGAHFCDYGIIVLRTDPSVPKHKGLSFFFLDMKSPGIEVRRIKQISGTSNFNEVFFTDVRVPAANVIGEVDDGWSVAKYLLGHERMGGGALGGLKKSVEQLKKIAREEDGESDGKLIDDPSFSRKIAEVDIELMTLEVQMLRLLSKMSADAEMGLEASMIKIRRSEIVQRLSELKMEAVGYYANPFVLGALEQGWNEEPIGGADYINALAAQYFNNRKHSIFAGSNEIQHNIIAKRVLGL